VLPKRPDLTAGTVVLAAFERTRSGHPTQRAPVDQPLHGAAQPIFSMRRRRRWSQRELLRSSRGRSTGSGVQFRERPSLSCMMYDIKAVPVLELQREIRAILDRVE
jgi:hypothetical protein